MVRNTHCTAYIYIGRIVLCSKNSPMITFPSLCTVFNFTVFQKHVDASYQIKANCGTNSSERNPTRNILQPENECINDMNHRHVPPGESSLWTRSSPVCSSIAPDKAAPPTPWTSSSRRETFHRNCPRERGVRDSPHGSMDITNSVSFNCFWTIWTFLATSVVLQPSLTPYRAHAHECY